MKQIKWFDRKFDFSFEQNIFPSIIERLGGTIFHLEKKISKLEPAYFKIKHNNTWSIQENLGHLIDLEPLWQNRLDDILVGKKYMREADLENTKTNLANHNDKKIADLFFDFKNLREQTLKKLSNLTEDEIFKYSLHPRLEKPMRIIDLFHFVAEHDAHHLARISQLNKIFLTKKTI